MSRPSRVVVRTDNLLEPAVYDGDDASRVEFYDPADPESLMAVFYQITPGQWVFTKRDDEDWQAVLAQIGYSQATIQRAAT